MKNPTKKNLNIEIFEVARFNNASKIKGGDGTNGGKTTFASSKACRKDK